MVAMPLPRRRQVMVPALFAAALAAGCGGSGGSSAPPAGTVAADAKSAATGDIPDNQQFLTYASPAGFSLRYPEGWSRRPTAHGVAFRDKQNAIVAVVRRRPAPTPASARAALNRLAAKDPTIRVGATTTAAVKGGRAIRISYRRTGPADPVTGKRPTLLVDRYLYARAGRVATLDLATPVGVDNVDAYRLVTRSFTWR